MDINNLDELKAMVEKANLDAYIEAITNFKNTLVADGSETIDDARIEGALLRKVCELEQAAASTTTSRPSSSRSVSEDNSNTQRFFINVGGMDGFDKDTLKDFIIKHCEGITNEQFSDSFVKDSYSFFELPKEMTDLVMKNLIGLKINERDVNVELSNKKPASGGRRGGSNHGFSGRGNYGRRDGGSGYGRRDGGSSYGHRDGGSSYGRRDGGSRGYGRSSSRGDDRGSSDYGRSSSRGYSKDRY